VSRSGGELSASALGRRTNHASRRLHGFAFGVTTLTSQRSDPGAPRPRTPREKKTGALLVRGRILRNRADNRAQGVGNRSVEDDRAQPDACKIHHLLTFTYGVYYSRPERSC
jgi:hypothetical protein